MGKSNHLDTFSSSSCSSIYLHSRLKSRQRSENNDNDDNEDEKDKHVMLEHETMP